MNLALLIGADPLLVKQGPSVKLEKGSWQIVAEREFRSNNSDALAHHSKLSLATTVINELADECDVIQSSHPLTTSPLQLQGPILVQVIVAEPGKEKHITVKAYKVG